MAVAKQAAVLAALFALGGCFEDTTAPHWATICVKSRTVDTSHMTTMGCGMDMMTMQLKCGTGMIWQIETKNVCDQTERQCVWGRDFQGERGCS